MLEQNDASPVAADARLRNLGAAFDHLVAELEANIQLGKDDEVDALYAKIDSIEREIWATRATTLEGLRVKARVTKWWAVGEEVLLVHNDVDRTCEIAFAESILRDLLAAQTAAPHAASKEG
jgi:hypothetical protein